MKKLLLSSSVVLIFCSVSFGQAKKVVSTPKETTTNDQNPQVELRKKKLAESRTSSNLQTSTITLEQKMAQEDKLIAQKKQKALENKSTSGAKNKAAMSLVEAQQ